MKYDKIPYKKIHLKVIRDLANFYGVRLVIRQGYKIPDAEVDLSLTPEVIILKLNPMVSISVLFSSFFHELAHVYCKHHKIYPLYNHYWDPFYFNQQERLEMIRTCMRAELYTDKVAKDLMGLHFPGIRFIASYTKQNSKFYKPVIQEGLREYFRYVDSVTHKK